jgi:hypothetical protein
VGSPDCKSVTDGVFSGNAVFVTDAAVASAGAMVAEIDSVRPTSDGS